MASTFAGAGAFNRNIADWNTAAVIDMGSTFRGASAFNQPIGNWSVASVSKMDTMLALATSFGQNVAAWNVTSVTSLAGKTPSVRASPPSGARFAAHARLRFPSPSVPV
jgi:surface protein